VRPRGRQDEEQFPEAEHPQQLRAVPPDGTDHQDACPYRDVHPWEDARPEWERCEWDAWDDARQDASADASQEPPWVQRTVQDADAGK
jgi:hypothetical protein